MLGRPAFSKQTNGEFSIHRIARHRSQKGPVLFKTAEDHVQRKLYCRQLGALQGGSTLPRVSKSLLIKSKRADDPKVSLGKVVASSQLHSFLVFDSAVATCPFPRRTRLVFSVVFVQAVMRYPKVEAARLIVPRPCAAHITLTLSSEFHAQKSENHDGDR